MSALASFRSNPGSAYLQRQGEPDIVIDHIDGTFDWRRISAPGDFDRHLRMAGRTGERRFLACPARQSASRRSERDDIAREERIAVAFRERQRVGRRASAICRAAVASAPSLRHLGRLANLTIPLPGVLGETSLTSDATIADNGFSFANLRLSLDRNEFEGTLGLRNDGPRPALAGTLAAKPTGPRSDCRRDHSGRHA